MRAKKGFDYLLETYIIAGSIHAPSCRGETPSAGRRMLKERASMGEMVTLVRKKRDNLFSIRN
jgi:hypothetical protein